MNLLIIGPFPDPIDGCSFANKTLCENLDKKKFIYKIINTNSKIISSKQGSKFSIVKAFSFLKVYLQLYKVFQTKVVYLTPGQTFYGILKYGPFMFTSWLFKKPYVIHLHGNYLGQEFKLLKGVKKKVFHFFISHASAGIVLSHSLKNNFKGLLTLEKIFVVKNFVGRDIYASSMKLDKLSDIPRIIYLSNLMEEKGILDLLDGLIILDSKNIAFKATIAGSIEKNIERKVKNKFQQLGNKLSYVGIIKDKEKTDALLKANIFVLPTYYKMEGQPISILEALATGNIILTTNHAGIPDIISDRNGILVDPKSSGSISESILNLSKNLKGEVEKFSVLNQNYALGNFTEDMFTDKIIQITNSVSN